MTDDAEITNPTIALIKRIREDILDRFYRGELNYERDRSVLLKHISLTQEMGILGVSAQLCNTLGMIDMELGYLAKAHQLFEQSYQLAETAQNTYIMSAIQNNLGELYRYKGDFPHAIKVYRLARSLANDAQENQVEAVAAFNMGLCAAALRDYKTAKTYFLQTYDLIKDAPWDYIRLLIAQRLGLAEVHLAYQELEEAWHLADEAETLTLGRNFKQVLPSVHLTKAHIASQDPDRRHEAKTYYALARQGWQDYSSPHTLAIALLQEARYQLARKELPEAHRLAKESLEIFHHLGLVEYQDLAQELLDSI